MLHCTQCPNTEFFLVRIFLYSDLIRTRKNSVFGHFSRSASDQNNEQEPKACSIFNRCEMIDRVRMKAQCKSSMWDDWQGSDKSSHLQMFFKIGVLKNFANFTGKHLCWGFILIDLLYRCFPVKFVKFLRAPFFTEHLRRLLLIWIRL